MTKPQATIIRKRDIWFLLVAGVLVAAVEDTHKRGKDSEVKFEAEDIDDVEAPDIDDAQVKLEAATLLQAAIAKATMETQIDDAVARRQQASEAEAAAEEAEEVDEETATADDSESQQAQIPEDEGKTELCGKAPRKCHRAVQWAMNHGIFLHPDRYPGLTTRSNEEEFMGLIAQKGGHGCVLPCKHDEETSQRQPLGLLNMNQLVEHGSEEHFVNQLDLFGDGVEVKGSSHSSLYPHNTVSVSSLRPSYGHYADSLAPLGRAVGKAVPNTQPISPRAFASQADEKTQVDDESALKHGEIDFLARQHGAASAKKTAGEVLKRKTDAGGYVIEPPPGVTFTNSVREFFRDDKITEYFRGSQGKRQIALQMAGRTNHDKAQNMHVVLMEENSTAVRKKFLSAKHPHAESYRNRFESASFGHLDDPGAEDVSIEVEESEKRAIDAERLLSNAVGSVGPSELVAFQAKANGSEPTLSDFVDLATKAVSAGHVTTAIIGGTAVTARHSVPEATAIALSAHDACEDIAGEADSLVVRSPNKSEHVKDKKEEAAAAKVDKASPKSVVTFWESTLQQTLFCCVIMALAVSAIVVFCGPCGLSPLCGDLAGKQASVSKGTSNPGENQPVVKEAATDPYLDCEKQPVAKEAAQEQKVFVIHEGEDDHNSPRPDDEDFQRDSLKASYDALENATSPTGRSPVRPCGE